MNGVAPYGHWGRPVLVFPTEGGDAAEFERHGMIDALGELLTAGRLKLYCVDSLDRESWSNRGVALEERALVGDHPEWLRRQVSLLLLCGQGLWEDTTGALESSRRFAALLAGKGIRCELDVWGHDVAHDWPWWRAQLAHHLPRFC